MHDRVDIRTPPVNLRVNMKLHGRHRIAFNEIAVEIDRDDVARSQRAAHRFTRVDQHVIPGPERAS